MSSFNMDVEDQVRALCVCRNSNILK